VYIVLYLCMVSYHFVCSWDVLLPPEGVQSSCILDER